MKINLIFLDSFKSSFKDKEYTIYQFLDSKSLTIISGTDLDLKGKKLEVFESYDCKIGLKSGKLKVFDIL